jgi:hypothetical protein
MARSGASGSAALPSPLIASGAPLRNRDGRRAAPDALSGCGVFSLDKADFAYEPYPICYSTEVFPEDLYLKLAKSYPPTELFSYKPELGDKYSLSEKSHADRYYAFLDQNPLWKELFAYIKSDVFIADCFAFLKRHHIDFGLKDISVQSRSRARKHASWLSRINQTTELSARFEFSVMGGQGGHIRPHTDDHRKMVTLVISMIEPGVWNDAWGGGTQVCLPKDRTLVYNQVNKFLDFDKVDLVRAYDFRPNQCITFIKTYNSWHQVAPLSAPAGSPERRTLTINIEKLL